MKKKIVYFLVSLSFATSFYFTQPAYAQSKDVFSVEECVGNRTKCVVCGGSCITACCNTPAPPVSVLTW